MKKTNLFNCTQQELYLVCKLGWQACREQLTKFSKHKARYTAAFVETRLAEVGAAEKIPNDKTRRDKPKEDRVMTLEAADVCLDYFQALKSYIQDAFSENMIESKLESAGQSYYQKAQAFNKDAVTNLNVTATQFIQNNLATLTADDNMPESFLTEYLDAKQAYDESLTTYLNSDKNSKNTTGENRDANNGIYKKLIAMMRDAQIVFKEDAVMRRQFTFGDLLARVSSPDLTTLRGKVTSATTGKAIKGVAIAYEGRKNPAKTDKTGKYDIGQLTGGLYAITFSVEGFKDFVVEAFDVKAGVVNKLDVVLEAVEVLV